VCFWATRRFGHTRHCRQQQLQQCQRVVLVAADVGVAVAGAAVAAVGFSILT